MGTFTLSKSNFLLPAVPAEFKDLNEVRALLVNYNNALKAIINSLSSADLSLMKLDGSNLAIGSDADGDIYTRSGGVLAKIAKGTAYQKLQMKSDASILEYVDGETPWADYSVTSTIVGWSSFTTKSIYYKKIGKTVFVTFYLVGTSNNTGVSFTLPFAASNTVETEAIGRASDNGGGAVAALVFVPVGTDIAYMCANTSGSGGTWTASGAKGAYGQFWYTIT